MRRERNGPVETLWLSPSTAGRGYVLADWQFLLDACQAVASDDSARCLVLRGEGIGFAVGADLADLHDHVASGGGTTYQATTRTALRLLAEIPLPTLAVVEGPCTAGSTAIVNACDVRIGSPSATFEFPSARVGLIYPQVSVQLLVRAVGSPAAKLLLYSGRAFDAHEALRLGLLQEMGEVDTLLNRMVAQVLEGDVGAHRAHKLLVDAAAQLGTPAVSASDIEQAGYDSPRFAAVSGAIPPLTPPAGSLDPS